MGQTLHLVRRDSGRNMARFYRLEVERDLFGAVVLTRRWGRIGTKGRLLEMVLGQQSEGEVILHSWQQKKELRGYRPA